MLGLARDGGWWVLGVTEAAMADCLRAIPMSRSDTGAVTLAALANTGSHVSLVPTLADVDTIDDVDEVRARLRARAAGSCAPPGRCRMLGNLYDRALDGERCWVRHDDGRVDRLPVRSWLGGRNADERFDNAVVGAVRRPDDRLGLRSWTFGGTPGRSGACLHSASISPPPPSRWRAAAAPRHFAATCSIRCQGQAGGRRCCLADGNVGLGGDPWRILRRAGELLRHGGRCVAEFDSAVEGIYTGWVRLESSCAIGPWFQWASVGIDCAARLADDVGFAVVGIHPIGRRVVASLAAT